MTRQLGNKEHKSYFCIGMKRFAGLLIIAGLSACGRAFPDAGTLLAPSIEMVSADHLTPGSAQLHATFSSPELVERCGFTVHGKGLELEIPAISEGNAMTATAIGLKSSSTYSFEAFAENGAGLKISSGNVEFTTLAEEFPPSPDSPVVISDAVFAAWLLRNFDSDADGVLSTSEAAMIDDIRVNTDGIASLAGLESFPNLTYLDASGTRTGDTGAGLLSSIDARSNSKLSVIYAPHNRIGSLILPDDPKALTRLELPVNCLESIDLRSCSSLSLVSLASNLIVSIDVSGMDALEELHLDDNPLERIVIGNKMLRYINLHGTSITEVDFSRCPRLDLADCSGCPDLKTIHLAKGQVIGTIRKDDTASIVYHDE